MSMSMNHMRLKGGPKQAQTFTDAPAVVAALCAAECPKTSQFSPTIRTTRSRSNRNQASFIESTFEVLRRSILAVRAEQHDLACMRDGAEVGELKSALEILRQT